MIFIFDFLTKLMIFINLFTSFKINCARFNTNYNHRKKKFLIDQIVNFEAIVIDENFLFFHRVNNEKWKYNVK